MNKILYRNFIQANHLSKKYNEALKNKYNKIFKKINFNLDYEKNIFHSLSKKFNLSFRLKDLNKFKKFKTIVIIGMGGSILGSKALYYFLKKKVKKEFVFFDNINQNQLIDFKKRKNLNKKLFIEVSKSGGTIETLSNLISLKVLKKNSKNIIIVSEKNDNPLYNLSKRMRLFHIEHKSYIGGRYSVLSEVGTLSVYLMGLNLKKFKKNFLNPLKNKNEKFLKESLIKLSSIFSRKKIKNLVFFNYVPELNDFLSWNQQLIAESLGKKGNGCFPTISNAPKDHHSLLQLYLDGPKDKLFYIFSYKNKDKKKIIFKKIDKKLNFLNNTSLDQVKMAQKNAFIEVLKNKKIPFREFELKEIDETVIGELFSYFILETAIMGLLNQVNPFDQPAVEQVKINTKKLLI